MKLCVNANLAILMGETATHKVANFLILISFIYVWGGAKGMRLNLETVFLT